MLLKQDVLKEILAGRIDTVIRLWRKPTVKPGGELKVAGWLLSIHEVEAIDDITESDAERAGYGSKAEALQAVRQSGEGQLYRIRVTVKGEDPRIALREEAEISETELLKIQNRLHQWDQTQIGPWTARTLQKIEEKPEVSSTVLAEELGIEKLLLKTNIRKLKGLGLTESLEVGYRISPRGKVVLERLLAS